MDAKAVAAVLGAVVLGAASCGSDEEDGAEPRGSTGETVEIVATDFEFEPASVDLDEPGVYTFRIVNDGAAQHALEIEGTGGEHETEVVGAGESAEVTVELTAGEYELYCPVGNHRDLGMDGTVVVGGAGSGGGGTTTTDGDRGDDGGYDY